MSASDAHTEGTIWIDGEMHSVDTAHVSASDHGVTVGDGVFETLKVVDEQAFALTRHLRRLRRSAEGLGLRVPQDDDTLRAAVADVLAANPGARRLRITLTGGLAPMGSGRAGSAATLIIAAGPAVERPPTAKVLTVPWRRNEHSAVAGLKTTSYAENVVALEHARSHGADEAIFANTAGNLCEGTGTNVFVGLDGRLVTPPLSAGCLAGITRELLLEIVDVVEADLPLSALADADEAFLTSSTRDVAPITHVDGVPLPAAPGPLTDAAAAAFTALEARTLDP